MKNLSLILLFILSFKTSAVKANSELCVELQGLVKSGDIVFISSSYYLFQKVSEATNTWANHVGIIFEREGQWVVAESKVPFSKTTPLCDFLNRTLDSKVSIRRVSESLTEDDIETLWSVAQEKMGVLYHLGFKYNSSRQFCSKFVYQVYDEALGLKVGQIQTLRDVLNENPNGSQGFWKLWFLGNIPWDRETVTPRNQLHDPNLKTVYSWEAP